MKNILEQQHGDIHICAKNDENIYHDNLKHDWHLTGLSSDWALAHLFEVRYPLTAKFSPKIANANVYTAHIIGLSYKNQEGCVSW
jgi:hypothetical protein